MGDPLGALHHLMVIHFAGEGLEGPVNLASPAPVRQADYLQQARAAPVVLHVYPVERQRRRVGAGVVQCFGGSYLRANGASSVYSATMAGVIVPWRVRGVLRRTPTASAREARVDAPGALHEHGPVDVPRSRHEVPIVGVPQCATAVVIGSNSMVTTGSAGPPRKAQGSRDADSSNPQSSKAAGAGGSICRAFARPWACRSPLRSTAPRL